MCNVAEAKEKIEKAYALEMCAQSAKVAAMINQYK